MYGVLALLILLRLLDLTPPDAVDLQVLTERYQVEWTSEAATGREILKGPGVTLVLVPSLSTAIINSSIVRLRNPVSIVDGRLRVPVELAQRLEGLAQPRPAEPDSKPMASRDHKKPGSALGIKPAMAWLASPNFQRAGAARDVRTIVLHTTEGSYESCLLWFRTRRSSVSAHYVISFEGKITQMVLDENIAWHVGGMNATSIGIEHEGFADQNLWTDAQYRSSAALTRYLCDTYKIPMDREHIISHASVDPQRRHDPGRYFDWSRYMALVRGGGK